MFVRSYVDQTEAGSCEFVFRLYQAAPIKITNLLTDNGSPFTDRFTGEAKQTSGKHAFDKRCAELEIEYRIAPLVTRKPTAWLRDSTAELPRSSGRRASNWGQNPKSRSLPTSTPTTTGSRNAR